MAVVDIGSAVINRDITAVSGKTYVNKENPANVTGKINSIQIWTNLSLVNVKVATFFVVAGNNLTARDSVTLATVTGKPETITTDSGGDPIALTVHSGDYIGIYYTSGAIERDEVGYGGMWFTSDDQTSCVDKVFGLIAGDAISLYATGVSPELPTVSTSAVTSISTTTAVGNGNITDTGYPWYNCTKRGMVYDITSRGDPGDTAPADSNYASYEEELGSFTAGTFIRPMTGLSRGEKYYVRAYTYNAVGYKYGSEVTFYTYPLVTTQTPTDIIRADPTTVTLNGLIELDVVEPIVTRGFKYGLTETDTWDKSSTGSFSEGTYSETIDSLTDDTTYYIRAYATSTGAWGTKYGSYLEFKTAYPYGANKTEIRSEATAGASDIAAVGGKRSLTIENHLIQNQTVANLISAGYLADHKDQKTKLVVTRPTPAPYQIGDTITRGSILFYYAAVSALINYAPAGSAEHPYSLSDRDMLIRKLNVSFSAGNYVQVIELESS